MRIADAQAPLLGRIDEEQAAERPERLAAERLLRLLVDDDDLLARLGQFRRGDQPGQPGADDDHVRIVSHFCSPGFDGNGQTFSQPSLPPARKMASITFWLSTDSSSVKTRPCRLRRPGEGLDLQPVLLRAGKAEHLRLGVVLVVQFDPMMVVERRH